MAQRQVMFDDFGRSLIDGPAEVLVSMSERSARIEARRYFAYWKNSRPDLNLTDDQMLREFMIMNWAWFDEND